MEQSFFYIVVVHVCIMCKAFSSFMSAVSEIIALILNRLVYGLGQGPTVLPSYTEQHLSRSTTDSS